MFLKNYRNHKDLFKPYSMDLLKLVSEQVLDSLGTVFDKKEPLSMDIFQILGTLLCDDTVPIETRIGYTEYSL